MVFRQRAEVDGFHKYFVLVLVAELLAMMRLQGRSKRRLRHFTGESRGVGMQRDDLTFPVCKNKQIAAGEPPQWRGSVLDRGLVVGRHQRAQNWQVGDEIGGMAESDFFFALETLEGADRIPQVRENFPGDL